MEIGSVGSTLNFGLKTQVGVRKRLKTYEDLGETYKN